LEVKIIHKKLLASQRLKKKTFSTATKFAILFAGATKRLHPYQVNEHRLNSATLSEIFFNTIIQHISGSLKLSQPT